MKPPYTQNGLKYFIDSYGQKICTGAQMGRRDIIPRDYAGERLHLRRVPLNDGSCYDPGGAYWGSGTPLFCAYGETETEQMEIYVRRNTREAAKAEIQERLKMASVSPAKFYR
jgi:hypothetical protein